MIRLSGTPFLIYATVELSTSLYEARPKSVNSYD